jgi:hypothetical protein
VAGFLFKAVDVLIDGAWHRGTVIDGGVLYEWDPSDPQRYVVRFEDGREVKGILRKHLRHASAPS